MKIRTIICFIFSILGLLALVAYFFPEDGIAVGSVRMKFPSLTEVLQTEEEKETLPTDTVSTDTLSTEELLQMRMDALKAEKESEFMTYCETNAARIYMPGDNIDYLDPFFDALEAALRRFAVGGRPYLVRLARSVPRTVRWKWRGVGAGRTNRPDLHVVTIRIAGRAIPTHRLWPQGYAARQ